MLRAATVVGRTQRVEAGDAGERMMKTCEDCHVRGEWRTPPEFWSVIDREFSITVDGAANAGNHLCDVWYGPGSPRGDDFINPMIPPQNETIYINPPFGKMMPWVLAAYRATINGRGNCVLMMARCAPSTRWWRVCVRSASEIRLLSPRVDFLAPPGIDASKNNQENALIIFGARGPRWPKTDYILTWYWKELAYA